MGCRAEGNWWCEPCQLKTSTLPASCPGCAKPTSLGQTCPDCVSHPLSGLTALFWYREEEPVGQLIRLLKYSLVREAAEFFSRALPALAPAAPAAVGGRAPVIMPVPLYRRRERERGFNQAILIAELCARRWQLSVTPGLARRRATAQQARLSRPERFQNVAGAFVWMESKPPPPAVILVDDVYTTGATMQECARVLRAAGARWVWGLVLARD